MHTNKFISRKRLFIFSTLSMIAVQAVVIGAAPEAEASDYFEYRFDPIFEYYLEHRFNVPPEEVKYMARVGANLINGGINFETFEILKGHIKQAAEEGCKDLFLELMQSAQHDSFIIFDAWKRHGKRALEAFRNHDNTGDAFDELASAPSPKVRGSDHFEYRFDPILEHYLQHKFNVPPEEVKYMARAGVDLVNGGINFANFEILKGYIKQAAEEGCKDLFLELMQTTQHDCFIVLEAWKRHGKRALEAFRNNDDAGAAFDAIARTPASDLWDELSAVHILRDLGFDENDPELQSAANYLHATYCADADDIDMENLMTALTIQRLNIDIDPRDDAAFYDLNLTLQDLGVGIDNYNEMLNQPENVELLRNLRGI